MTTGTDTRTEVRTDEVIFRIPDPDRTLAAVNLYQEITRPRNGPPFAFDETSGAWELRLGRPDCDRIEYLIELVDAEGNASLTTDPTNPAAAPGPFGDKSVIEFSDYSPPGWTVREPSTPGDVSPFEISSRILRAELPGLLWSAPGTSAGDPVPLLVVHDGVEYAELSLLTRYLDDLVERTDLKLRAALLAPVERDQTYSASAAYARALAHEILVELGEIAPTPHGRSMRIGMGASLGALAMLHAHRAHPAAFGGLFLQSGSYFRQRYDPQESGFVRFRRISRFVGKVLNSPDWPHPIPVTITCGTIEENLANNRAIRDALGSQGYEVTMIENRDGHNWVGWRDAFDPALGDLLTRMWG